MINSISAFVCTLSWVSVLALIWGVNLGWVEPGAVQLSSFLFLVFLGILSGARSLPSTDTLRKGKR
jgi:H+/Cl- antiporter ClcA